MEPLAAIAGVPLYPARRCDGVCRVLDIMLAAALLVFAAPLMALIAAACWLQDGGPALYRQKRIGLGGAPFVCLKFRSMAADAERRLVHLLAHSARARAEWEENHKLSHDPRITPLGRFLRQSSLDELPQLINVLRGEMSLVGPRPIVAAEIARYGRFIGQYHSVRPGLTGLWQISGRSLTTYRRRVSTDVVYSRTRSVGLYFRILLGTPAAVLMRRGAV